ncbi:hypothetical protein V8E36_008417 [Tilletia maclaganii]
MLGRAGTLLLTVRSSASRSSPSSAATRTLPHFSTTPAARLASRSPSMSSPVSADAHAHEQGMTPRKRKRTSPSTAPSSPPASVASTSGPSSAQNVTATHAWPAPATALRDAERFILQCARAGEKVLLVPDKDADGLSAGAILYRTLCALGLDESLLSVHLMNKGNHPGSAAEREAMSGYGAKWIIVLDQGSREGPALVDGAELGWEWEDEAGDAESNRVHTMVLDHHFLADPLQGGPRGALLVNASHSEPVATTALLTWHICRPLLTRARTDTNRMGGAGLSDEEAGDRIDWLCLLGTMGDLSVNVKWDPPFPDMKAQIKRYSKKKLGTAIALLNAPRRTPAFDTITAWRVLLHSDSPATIADGLGTPSPSSSTTPSATFAQDLARLFAARSAVAAETERCTHTPPKFSRDGRVALLRIQSGFQVHPSIATRWSGTLRGAKKLQAVMCANDGYSDAPPSSKADGTDGGQGAAAVDDLDDHRTGGMTHFSCRIAQAAKSRGEDPNLIELLHDYAARDPTFLRDLKDATENENEADDASLEENVPDATTGPSNEQPEGDSSAPTPPARISVGNFARGHRQASGGIIPHEFFERFVTLMEIGVKDPPEPGSSSSSSPKKRKTAPTQSNTLMSYFKKV